MANILSANTKIECSIRSALHRLGYRFALHSRKLPGRPDVVLPKYGAVILIHGCYWHRHTSCHYASTPLTRVDFWKDKFCKNVVRDKRNIAELRDLGWRVFVVWECGIRHKLDKIIDQLDRALQNDRRKFAEFPSKPVKPKSRRT